MRYHVQDDRRKMDDAAREYEDVEYGVVMLDTLPREKDNTKRVSNAASNG